MATKDCTFFVDINGRQVEMDFDGFRAYLMQDGVMATLAPDLTKKRGKSAGFTVTAQKAEPTPTRAEPTKARAKAPIPSEMEVSSENLRKLMPKLSKARADAIIAVMKAMGIPFDRLKIAKGKLEGKETLQQADTKARDAEYMAAVKAGDTAKAQKMVDEAAKAAGYTTGPVYHGTKQRFSVFKSERDRTGLIYFSENEKFAEQYARGTGKKRAASPEVQVRITSARRQADELVSQLLTDAEKRFGGFSQIPLSVQEDAIAKGRDLERGLLGGMTASEAETQMGVRVVKAYLKASSIFDPRQHWREYLPVIARSVNKSPTNLDAQFLAHVKAGHYLVWEHPDVIDAILRDYDAVRLQETEGETASTLAVRGPSQIKSADPVTYDDKGNVIPLSERFKSETPDIRYQGEASPLGSITFIDDLNALISVFEKANFSTVIHEAMHFYRRHMLNTAQGFTTEEIKRFERWAGAKGGKWSVQAEEKAARAFERYLRDGVAPIPELKSLFAKVAKWMKEVYATLKGTDIDIEIPADIRKIFDRIFTLQAEKEGRLEPPTKPGEGAETLLQEPGEPQPSRQARKEALRKQMEERKRQAFTERIKEVREGRTKPEEARQTPPAQPKAAQPKPATAPSRPAPTSFVEAEKAAEREPKQASFKTTEQEVQAKVKKLYKDLTDRLRLAKQAGISYKKITLEDGVEVDTEKYFDDAVKRYAAAQFTRLENAKAGKKPNPEDVIAFNTASHQIRFVLDAIIAKPKRDIPLHFYRSPLSYSNVIGSYEGIMGAFGKEISDLFVNIHTDIAYNIRTFWDGIAILEEQLNNYYYPKLKAMGYEGMKPVIKAHVTYIKSEARFRQSYTRLKQQSQIMKDPVDWLKKHRDFAREINHYNEKPMVFPMLAAMVQGVIYNVKLRFNAKSAFANYSSLIISVGPYMAADELAGIIAKSMKSSEQNRVVADDGSTLREVAIRATGGREAGQTDASRQESKLRGALDWFQKASEGVRIAGYLVGEEMANRVEQSKGIKLSESARRHIIRDWIEKIEFDNSPWNRAPMFRGALPSVIFQFKPFLQKNLERLYYDLKRDPVLYEQKTARTELGKEWQKIPFKYRRVFASIGYQVGWGGVASALTVIPGLKGMAGILLVAGMMQAFKGIGLDDDDAETAALGLYYGAPAVFGLDLSSTVSYLDDVPGKDIYEQVLSFFGGPAVGGVAKAIYQANKAVIAAQKEVRPGREKEQAAEVARLKGDIVRGVTPYMRMLETAYEIAQGQPSTMYLGKEEPLTTLERAFRLLGATNIRQTRYYDDKEAYSWQKKLFGRPTGYETLKPRKDEDPKVFQQRRIMQKKLQDEYFPKLFAEQDYKDASPEEQKAMADTLSRNINEQTTRKEIDKTALNPKRIIRNRKASLRKVERSRRRDIPLTLMEDEQE